jgi:hypothetical protein
MKKSLLLITLVLCSTLSSLVFATDLSCNNEGTLKDLNTIADFPYTVYDLVKEEERVGKTLEVHDELKSRWHEPKGEVKSVTVLIHGLNFKIGYMRDVIALYNKAGSRVLSVSLPGYREKLDPKTGEAHTDFELQPATFPGILKPLSFGTVIVDKLAEHPEHKHDLETFHNHIMKAYCLAKASADKINKPIIFSGYSMAGAMITSLFSNPELKEELAIEKLILFSPTGFGSYTFVSIIDMLISAAPDARLPSKKQNYNYERSYKTKQLRGINEANKMLLDYGYSSKVNIPTKLILNSKDKLVPLEKVEHFLATELTEWSILSVDNKYGLGHKTGNFFHHTLVLEKYVGKVEWQRISKELIEFINE